jgi:rubrerythrin
MFRAEITGGEVLSKADSVTYTYYQQHIKPKPEAAQKKGYRCNICGYIYEGEALPADIVCPLCKHGAIDFVKIT